VKSQFALARVIGPSLYAGIEFSDRDMPMRWWSRESSPAWRSPMVLF
jgi:hypothetical protein